MIIPIGNQTHLKALTLRLEKLYYTRIEEGKDVKGNPLFRLRDGKVRLAIVVVTNPALLIPVETEVKALCKPSKNF